MNGNGDRTFVSPAGSGQEKGIRLPIATLAPDLKNPRRITDEARAGLGVSLETFGALDVVFNETTGELVSGHQRIERLKAAGATELVRDGDWGFITHPKTGERFPVRFVTWSATKQNLANLVANSPELQGTFTEAALDHLRALEDEVNFAALGLDRLAAQLEKELDPPEEAAAGNTDPDDVPEPPVEPISKRGDLWILGEHRILCGDSTNADDVQRLMGGQRAIMMATDPPYLVNYTGEDHPQSAERKKAGKSNNKNWDAYKDPETSVAFFATFIRTALQHALIDAPAIYQWHASRRQTLVEEAWTANGLLLHQQVVWVKARPILTRSHFMWQHEPCFYGWIEGKPPALRPPVSGACTTVWAIDQRGGDVQESGDEKVEHPTQKPVEIFQRPLSYHTRPGDIVYEPFSGSGSQIIAAERLGRRCFAMELAPEFVDVAVERWSRFTGKKAVRSEDANG
jgi:DNA modification methylase